MKPGARPGGTPGAPPGQPGAEGESVFSKILPGGAAEQAGKLTEGIHCLGSGLCWVDASLVEVGEMGWFQVQPPGHRPPVGTQCFLGAPYPLSITLTDGPGQESHPVADLSLSVFYVTAVSAFGKKFSSFW